MSRTARTRSRPGSTKTTGSGRRRVRSTCTSRSAGASLSSWKSNLLNRPASADKTDVLIVLKPRRVWRAFVLSLAGCVVIQAQTVRDLIQTNLDDLMNMEVTSVSKKEQKLSKAGAAVYVITREDIRR